MRAIWKGTISFGLVNIPVALGIATQRSDPKFRTLDAETLRPIRQQLFSPERGEVVGRDETVKGYEVSKDNFVVVSEEELESVAVERRRSIDILGFVDQGEIDPVYYDRSYYTEPQDGAEKPYALLVDALAESGRVALGNLVLSSREHLVVLRPSGRTLVIELLFYPEDVRSKAEIEERMEGVKATKAEVEMAKQLVDSLSGPFEPEEHRNLHKQEVMALIERKLAGEEIPIPAEPAAPARAVPDLMSALKASLAQAKSGATEETPRKPAAKKKSATRKKAAPKKPPAAGNGSKKKAASGRKSAAR
ncbi:MAG TPA: Ku protein [Thermoleophilaceae bacterium]|nr:Ku protein [Thermoleophilaceae bacterium]